jgi:hypothetical protein
MQENNTEMLNKEFTLIKQTIKEEFLVTYYKLIYYKLKKLQISNVEVISLA